MLHDLTLTVKHFHLLILSLGVSWLKQPLKRLLVELTAVVTRLLLLLARLDRVLALVERLLRRREITSKVKRK